MQFFRNCANAPICDSLVREAIASGRIMNEEEAVRQALLRWEERERQRVEILGVVAAPVLPWHGEKDAASLQKPNCSSWPTM